MAKRAKCTVILPDIHFGLSPWDENARLARECALLCIERLPNVDEVVFSGDALECAAFSRHIPASLRDVKSAGYIETEVEPCVAMMDRIQDTAKILSFVEGNHEHRVFNYLVNRLGAHALSQAFKALAPSELLARKANGKKRRNFTYIPYQGELPHYSLGPDLIVVHGWSHGANATLKHLDAARCRSVIHGHTHRRQEVMRRDPISGRQFYGVSPGCLAPLQPDYARGPTDHTHGFTVVYQSRENPLDWTHYVVGIQHGRAILPDGSEVKAT